MVEKAGMAIDLAFTGTLYRDDSIGGWTIVDVPGSDVTLGTRKAVKVGGRIDGQAFRATLMPSGNGPHLLPINAALRKRIGKDLPGSDVTVHLTERFT